MWRGGLERYCPVRERMLVEVVEVVFVYCQEGGNVDVEHAHDGFDFLPVNFLCAVWEEGAPKGSIFVLHVLPQVIDLRADIRV